MSQTPQPQPPLQSCNAMLSVSLQISTRQFNVVCISADRHPATQQHLYLCRLPPCNSTLSASLQIAALQFRCISAITTPAIHNVICISANLLPCNSTLSASLQIFKPLMSPLLSPDTVSKHPKCHLHESLQITTLQCNVVYTSADFQASDVAPVQPRHGFQAPHPPPA